MYKLYKQTELLEDQTTSESLNELLKNNFIFSRKYDMERCDRIIENNPIKWDYVPFGDPEWAFVLNRMDYCYDLCIETIKTGDLKYIYKSKDFIFDWISKNVENDYNIQTRTLDSGIRLINWVECLRFFKQFDIILEPEEQEMLLSIKWQCKYIDEKFQNFQNFSNWGLMQSIGILNASAIIDTGLEDKYLKMLNQHLDLEFLEDGMQWEQSAIYILEVLVRLLQLKNNKALSKQYYDVLRKSSYAVRALTNVNGKTVLIGDGDEVDTIGYLQRIAYILKDEEILNYVKGHQLREEVYWDFGDNVISYFNEAIENVNSPKRKQVYTLESAEFVSVQNKNSYLSFQNGNIGGGHGHFDNLHINYSWDNKKVLVDRGRYTYVEGSQERIDLKSREAHNVLVAGEYDLSYRDAWNNDGLHLYSGIKHLYKNNIDYFYGLATVENGKVTTRTILSFENGTLLVADYYKGKYELKYHLDYEASIDENNIINGNLKFKTFNNEIITQSESYIASVYNTKNKSIVLSIESENNSMVSCFVPSQVSIEAIDNFKHMYHDRISEYEKNMMLFKMRENEKEYIIGIKLIDAGNVDNVIQVNDKYLHGSIFVYDVLKDKNTVFKY